MKIAKKTLIAAVVGMSVAGSLVGGTAQAAPAPAPKLTLPVVQGAQSLSDKEKAATAGQGLVDLNVTALNGLNVLNNLNVLNIGSFNKFIKKSGSDCGCGIGPS